MNWMYHLWNLSLLIFGLLFIAFFVFLIVMAFKENKISPMPLREWMKTLAMAAFGLCAGVITLSQAYEFISKVYL